MLLGINLARFSSVGLRDHSGVLATGLCISCAFLLPAADARMNFTGDVTVKRVWDACWGVVVPTQHLTPAHLSGQRAE